jgi:hypothetical protein
VFWGGITSPKLAMSASAYCGVSRSQSTLLAPFPAEKAHPLSWVAATRVQRGRCSSAFSGNLGFTALFDNEFEMW